MLLVIMVIAWSSPAAGQNRLRRYEPDRPTITPYLNLVGPGTGVVPNYYSLVRPQFRQIADERKLRELAEQRRTTVPLSREELAGAIDLLNQERLAIPTGTRSGFQVYSLRQSFRDYSHFYPPAAQFNELRPQR
jgi:hypothetical protein